MDHPISVVEAHDIEGLIDRVGLATVLRCIAEICQGKSEHLLVNWGDKLEARRWGKDADRIERIANQVTG